MSTITHLRCAALFALASLGTGCAREAPARAEFVALAASYEPEPRARVVEVLRREHAVVEFVVESDGRSTIRATYGAGAFAPTPKSGAWMVERLLPAPSERSPLGRDERVAGPDGTGVLVPYGFVSEAEARAALDRVPERSFGSSGDLMVVHVADGAPAPERLEHVQELDLGRPQGGAWRFRTQRFAADGILLASGDAARVDLPAGRARSLTFTLVADGRLGHLVASGARTLRVSQAGRLVHEERFELGGADVCRDLCIDLVDSERVDELVFELAGPFALAGLADPQVGPRDRRAARSADPRPDIVVVLADTFRADNLVPGLGRPGGRARADGAPLAPALEAFLADARRYTHAFAPSTWTLPSHASLFTSLTPAEHGALRLDSLLSSEPRTLAEVLRAAGYRTLAVTDGAYVSSVYGLDRGFACFDEVDGFEPLPLDRARAALASHDGRPTFLFLHSYYTHTPYRPSDAAVAAIGGGASAADYARDYATALEAARRDPAEWDEATRAALARGERLYRAQVVDFDAEFARLWEAGVAAGRGEEAVWVFTSDHGESFGENGQIGHRNRPFDAEARVPLALRGPGIAAELRRDRASGLDLAPTLARLAGADVPATWRGTSLLGDLDGTVWSQVLWEPRDGPAALSTAALRADTKVFLRVDGSVEGLYDLARDPREEAPISASRWPEAVLRELRTELPGVTRARHAALTVQNPSSALRERLRAMGYVDDE
jgi:arylsulfatase A-like enzyme